ILYKAELKYGLLLNKIFFINMKVIVIRILIIHNTFFNRYFLPFGQINFRKKYISFKFMMNLCYIHLLNVRQEQFIICSPPKIKISSSFLQISNTPLTEWTISQPSKLKSLSLVKIIFLLRGKALPIDSRFLLPNMIGCPIVMFLTYAQSFGILHGISLFLPMTLFLSIATIKDTFIYDTPSYIIFRRSFSPIIPYRFAY